MTKEAYFEMCEMLGEEPVESEIPTEINDFPILVQTAFAIYGILTDRWDTFSGYYLGKDYTLLFSLLDLHQVEACEKPLMLELLQHIDSIRSKIIADKVKNNKSPATKQ